MASGNRMNKIDEELRKEISNIITTELFIPKIKIQTRLYIKTFTRVIINER